MEKVERDQTVGLVVLLATLVALAVFSASLPVMADYQAEQNVTVSKSETLLIKNQNETYDVTYWNFTATIGTNSTDVINSWAESQNPSDNNTPVARIQNPNSALDLIIYLNASEFSGTATVSNEWYNLTNTTDNTTDADGISTALTFDTDTDTGNTIYATEFRNLWLKIYATTSGTATSTFKVLGEGA
ncbi:MAG: hypothetical protein EFT35_01235 [Methanophagales archaeon ANME-1-THS]|nr:MAG: hypothetical protein EFT35_01235 [Methanophagales archaeon ANME-1-THS]